MNHGYRSAQQCPEDSGDLPRTQVLADCVRETGARWHVPVPLNEPQDESAGTENERNADSSIVGIVDRNVQPPEQAPIGTQCHVQSFSKAHSVDGLPDSGARAQGAR